MPDAGGAWSGPSTVVGGQFDPAAMQPGVYTYTISVPPPCVNAVSSVAVDVIAPPDGTNGSLTLCISSPAASLFSALGGTPDAGGTWSGPSTVTGGLFNPASMTAGDYTYTVNGVAPCPAESAVVSVAVVAAPDAGTPGSTTLCSSDAAIDLFALLGGTPDAGGAWSGPSVVTGGQFNPAAMQPGVYTYTINVPPPCVNVSSTVSVDVVAPPDAGTDGSLTLCISSPAASLFSALQGTPDTGGTWSGPSVVTGGLFDPAAMMAGDYTYTVIGLKPCPAVHAAVSVAVVAAPDAGQDAILNLCATGSAVELYPVLGGGADTGVWSDPDGNPFNGTFIPGTSPAGAYTYTVPGQAPCPSASATVIAIVLTDAHAGMDAAVVICSTTDSLNLFNQLQGLPNPGGHWLAPDGAPFGGVFNAGTNEPGTYLYVVNVPPPCTNDTAAVQVSIVVAANAGISDSITLCSSGPVIGMIGHLGGTPGETGSWTAPDGSAFGAAFHPGVDVPGVYLFTVAGTAPCPDAHATLSIAVNTMPNAGLDGSLALCPEADAADLFSLLGDTPDAGGNWTGPGGLPHGGFFDPAQDANGAYVYTVAGTAPCPNDQASATLQVHVVQMPDAGPDAISCTYEATLGATGTWATGQWSGPAGVLVVQADSASTATTVHTGGAYTYTWTTVSAEGCAGSDSVTITFTDPIVPEVAVTDALCNGACNGEAQVSASGGNVGLAGYQYQWATGTGGILPASAGLCAGTYSVTVLDTNGCSSNLSFTVLEPEPLVIDQLDATDELCPGSCDGTLLVADPEGALYSIDGVQFQGDALFPDLCAGTYTVTMLDDNGCSASSSTTIHSPPPVHAFFSLHPDTVTMNHPLVAFDNMSSANAAQFHWDFGDGATSSLFSPEHTFPMGVEAEYVICLTAMTVNGCPDTYCTTLPVVGLPGVYVPNAFTPDGDGRNEIFLVQGSQISSGDFSLRLFDRWGEVVFESSDPATGWDGMVKGIPAKQDVYVWQATVRFTGAIEVHQMRGHVTLLR